MAIYEYTDYRKYLKEFYLRQKSRNPSYSYRVFAHRAKLASPNYLKLVIDGKRRITDRLIHPFVRGLGLDAQQARYFRSLVLHQDTSDVEAKDVYLNELIKIRRKHLRSAGAAAGIAKDRDEILKKWHHWAIREMVLLKDFSSDPAWIAQRLGNRITPKEAQESIELLERLHFIARKGDRYLMNQPLISTSDEISSLLIRNLHRQFMTLGLDSVFNDPIDKREINGLTIALPKSRIPEMKNEIKKFRKALNQKFSSELDNEEIYHLTINLFPLTKAGRKS